jgi:hypothetical protein
VAGSLTVPTIPHLFTTLKVELTRALKGAGSDYFTFSLNGSAALPFINAVGSGPQFAYHKEKLPSSLLLLPVAAPACVCAGAPMSFGDGSAKGKMLAFLKIHRASRLTCHASRLTCHASRVQITHPDKMDWLTMNSVTKTTPHPDKMDWLTMNSVTKTTPHPDKMDWLTMNSVTKITPHPDKME